MILVLISFNALENSLLVEKVFNIFNLIAIMNSAMNPLIYAFFSPTFRASTVWAITNLFRRGHSRRTSELNYRTTVTGMSLSSRASRNRSTSTFA